MTAHEPVAAEPQVTQPVQERSRATMERIVTATTELLAERSFDQVTIAEISARAGCAPTAIYARFSDKTALLLELHRRYQDAVTDRIQELIPARIPPDSAIPLVRGIVEEVVALYRTHRGLLRAVLLSDNAIMYARSTDLTRTVSVRLAHALSAAPDSDRARDIDFAVKTALALVQQELLYGSVPTTLFDFRDELAPRVADLIIRALL